MQASSIVYPLGKVKITLSANESIAVYTQGACQVFRQVGYPNLPSTVTLTGTVINTETIFGPYTTGAVIILEAGAAEVAYETGLSPVIIAQRIATTQGAPAVRDTTGGVTAAMMLAGVITSSTAAAVAGTLPTGAVLDTSIEGLQVGQAFDWSVINTGPNAFTVTAATGHTLVGNMVVAAGKAARFRTLKAAASTYISYSLSNT